MSQYLNLASAALNAAQSRGLYQLIYFVTARCNARCRMCFYLEEIENANKNLTNELTLDEVKQIFSSMGRIPYVALSGGEPFLRRDIQEILDAIVNYSRPLMVSVPTNGSLSERVVETFSRLAHDWPNTQFDIQLSIDGMEDVHDMVRQVPGLFGKMMKTHDLLKEPRQKYHNLGIKIVVTYSAFNQHNVEETIQFIDRELTFDRLVIAKTHGDCDDAAKDNLNMHQYIELLSLASEINDRRSDQRSLTNKIALRVKGGKERLRGWFDSEQNLGKYCNAVHKMAVLTELGDVYPCEILDSKIGNVRETDCDLKALLDQKADSYLAENPIDNCHCDWGCGQNIAVVTNPRFWPELLRG